MRNFFYDIYRLIHVIWVLIQIFIYVPLRQLFPYTKHETLTIAILIRRALETLGLTYLKLGQFFALRHDIFPGHLIQELSKLFERVPGVPFGYIEKQINVELGKSWEHFFLYIDPKPIAAGTIAQVHKGWTLEGEKVAIKVQRPKVAEIMASDMRNLLRLGKLIDLMGISGAISAEEAIEEFANFTIKELNFELESYSIKKIRETALANEIVPQVFDSLSTQKVLTMEFLEGVSLSRVLELKAEGNLGHIYRDLPGLDFRTFFEDLFKISFQQLYLKGYYHGDPHPGNILIMKDMQIGYVDFGITGRLSGNQMAIIVGYVVNITLGNFGECASYFAKQCIFSKESDKRSFLIEIKRFAKEWYEDSMKKGLPKKPSTFYITALSMMRRYQVRMNMDFMLYWRALMVLESIPLQIIPDFDLLNELNGFFKKHLIKRMVGEAIDTLDLTRIRDIDESITTLAMAVSRKEGIPFPKRENLLTPYIHDVTNEQFKGIVAALMGFFLLLIGSREAITLDSSLNVLIGILGGGMLIRSLIAVFRL